MSRLCATVLSAGLLLGSPVITFAQEIAGLGLPLLVDIPSAPIPVRADGKFRLVYELHLTNAEKKPVTLQRVEVWSTTKLATIEGHELSKAIKTIPADAKEPRTIAPGAHTVILMWISLDAAPENIRHRIEGTTEETLRRPLWSTRPCPSAERLFGLGRLCAAIAGLPPTVHRTTRITGAAGSRIRVVRSFRSDLPLISCGCTTTVSRRAIQRRTAITAVTGPKRSRSPTRVWLR